MIVHLALVLTVGTTPERRGGCEPNDVNIESFASVVFYNVGRRRTPWHGLEFVLADTATIRPVLTDSLCRLALATLNAYMDKAYGPVKRILLVRVGKYYVAQKVPEHPTNNEFQPQYFFDSTLTRVLYPCRDGSERCR